MKSKDLAEKILRRVIDGESRVIFNSYTGKLLQDIYFASGKNNKHILNAVINERYKNVTFPLNEEKNNFVFAGGNGNRFQRRAFGIVEKPCFFCNGTDKNHSNFCGENF